MFLKVLGYALMVVGGIAVFCACYLSMPWVCDAGKAESRFIALLGFGGVALLFVGYKLAQ